VEIRSVTQNGLLSPPQALLFDLDGTLIDSAPDIAAAANRVLAENGLDPVSVADVRAMIGNGVGKLTERAFAARGVPLAGEALAGHTARLTEIYEANLTVLTRMMPGAVETLAAAKAAGIRTAVVSNKPHALTAGILNFFGLTEYLDAFQGAEDHLPKKPAPDMLLAALDRAGASHGRAWMIGDSIADVDAARAAKLPVVLVRGGYTVAAVESLGGDLVIDSLYALPALFAEPLLSAAQFD
jgi:phosphoglycolate phosphatase